MSNLLFWYFLAIFQRLSLIQILADVKGQKGQKGPTLGGQPSVIQDTSYPIYWFPFTTKMHTW